MGSAPRRFRCGAIGIGCKHGLRLHLEKCWQTTKWNASKSAPIRIAGGFSTIQPRPGPSAGATTAPAATARASAVPGPHKSKKPDDEISSVVRPAAESADRKSGTFPSDKRQKLIARLLIVTKRAEHGAGDGLAMLLFHAAHLHAQMAGFDNHANTLRSDFFLDGLGNLTGHALLNLQTARKHVDHACNLAESQHTLLRQIGDMGFAEERQEVVFAEAEEFDVFNDDHLVVGHAERRAVQYMIDVQVVTAGQILERFLETLRRLAQPFAIGILSDDLDDLAHVAGNPARIDFLLIVQQNFFGWLGHDRFPSRLSPAYSKLLFPVSWTRMRSSFAWGKDFKRR